MRRIVLATAVSLLLNFPVSAFQEEHFLPGAEYSSDVPSLKQVVGHAWGEKVSSYAELERYLEALAAASPRIELQVYGETWEGRKLYYLIVSSEENLGRLEEIKRDQQLLANGSLGASELQQAVAGRPVVVWLGYGIHGNEISSPEAATLTAYHLAASGEDPLARTILENCIVLIDPLQNPDGRDRFVSYFRQTRGRWPDADPDSAEHNEDWPGGRSNHYLFDMNRDYFALTQPETRGRVRLYLEWFPQVFVDLHEMGGNSTYYFAPPADPLNPHLSEDQVQWLAEFGRNNASWFDRMRFDYFTRQVYDSFYPGYGEGWPMFHGSIGMTYEQASVRGLLLEREDETILSFRESIQHHFIASLSTLESAAANRGELLVYFHDFRKGGLQEGGTGSIAEFIFPPGEDPNRVKKLVNLLRDQGIQVNVSGSSFQNESASPLVSGMAKPSRFPAHSYIVPVAQPAARLVLTLLERETPMDEAFLAEQKRRRDKRIGDQIYDVTAWSLPLLYDVDCFTSTVASQVDQSPVTGPLGYGGSVDGGPAQLAYLVPWGTNSAARFLAGAFRRNLRVHATDEPFRIEGVEFPRGSLIIKRRDNPDDLAAQVEALAGEYGVSVKAVNSGWVEEGVNFGSRDVQYLPRPSLAMLYSEPTRSSSVGATRYLLEQVYGYPVTILHSYSLRSVDLDKYNVLILPDASRFRGGYSSVLGETGANRIKRWVEEGGTLVAIGEASEWLTGEQIGLLATQTESMEKQEKEEGDAPPSLEELIEPEDEAPFAVPGALLKLNLDPEHWLAYGYDEDAVGLVNSRNIFTPLKLNEGRNVATYAAAESLVLAGLVWEESRPQLAHKAFLMHQRHGRGNVVAFAEDPNFRAFMDGLNLLFLNALFFGPAH